MRVYKDDLIMYALVSFFIGALVLTVVGMCCAVVDTVKAQTLCDYKGGVLVRAQSDFICINKDALK